MEQHTAGGEDAVVVAQLGALWGKSKQKAGGTTNLLLSHLLDTAAVAELMWERFLAPSTRGLLERLAGGGGRGRRLFVWLCGVHDCGKATPAFQRMDADGAQAVRAVGLSWRESVIAGMRHGWRHDRAGGKLIRDVLREVGWQDEHVEWVWPLVAGHHGLFPSAGDLREPKKAAGQLQGKGAWPQAQRGLLSAFTHEIGAGSLADLQPVVVPTRAEQLFLSGLVVMADWIASDEKHFQGVDALEKVSLAGARVRAEAAWAELGLRGGWGGRELPGRDVFLERFGEEPRPSQRMVIDAARAMAAPGLMVVDAPMGEGKTKAALAAAEVLAARFGADGVFVGMPTQATSDPMFDQVRAWVKTIDPELASQVALLHGKRMFNKTWKALLEAAGSEPDGRFGSVDEYGCCDDAYGMASGGAPVPERQAPAEWFLGRHRGLLCPFVVGTIDQLLFAATRTKHVMLRMAGLAGKVVILDEVHAADVYMSQFLKEGLRWLGQARVPVVLLSATLAPAQREDLVRAYLAGAEGADAAARVAVPQPRGYPCVTAAWPGAEVRVEHCESWRDDLAVRVEVLPETMPTTVADAVAVRRAADAAVADLLDARLSDGGCALVIRNTVDRAQTLFDVLRTRFGADEVRLLHGRLTVQQRAERTAECLTLLGPQNDEHPRPARLIVVATQLAEQSFDVDADLLVTDLTTVDLLLQRIGRMHRHTGVRRPSLLRQPTVVVTGMTAPQTDVAPTFVYGSEGIYGRYLLLRTAAVVAEADGRMWQVPSQVPELVSTVYAPGADVVSAAWRDAEHSARQEWDEKQRDRADSAGTFLLSRPDEHDAPTLEGLHYAGAVGSGDTDLNAAVRDGDRTLEVILIRDHDSGFATLAGRRLTANGDVAPELLDEVLGGTVRLSQRLSKSAEKDLVPLPAWIGHSWLRHSRALVLDAEGRADVGGICVRYDDELGVVEERLT
ncbi:CRISPR-associated helicase Cas3' [Yinghuangia sp. ASG 101]|uniref:CRISPR-associated helicase Cas3' n=1 Tax=Yinghuangia sp. ASG 101 TaxID=2896848 RepID=UPI001E4B63DA|nr:CRISPR-associated helicase Cas3' [Yinghuangia sp. ASG 101]UGQ10907.1 CRISPR-associated helicase Cas3' [Yinghuangia sp. ASG 101]